MDIARQKTKAQNAKQTSHIVTSLLQTLLHINNW